MSVRLNVRDEMQKMDPDDIKSEYIKTSTDVEVAGINLSGDLNIGMMIRTASLFGVGGFNIIGRKRYDRRTTVGTHNYIPMRFYTATTGHQNEFLDEEKIIEALKDLGKIRTLVFLEQGGTPLFGFKSTLPTEKPPLFIVGNEGDGIPQGVMDAFPDAFKIEIPQRGVGRSHNVSIALALMLGEYFRDSF